MDGLAGAHIAVTGGGGGIGTATCAWLADKGALVHALDLKPATDQIGEFGARQCGRGGQ